MHSHATAEETLSFNAEVCRLLELVARSLDSEQQIFLRELISDASNACERLQFLALTEPALVSDDPHYRVTISLDRRRPSPSPSAARAVLSAVRQRRELRRHLSRETAFVGSVGGLRDGWATGLHRLAA